MHYVIYIDRVWLMAFAISTYLLFLVRTAYGLRSSMVRLLISAAAGASAFVLILLLPGIGFWPKVFLQAVCGNLLLLKAAFSFRTKEMVVKSYICMNGYGLFMGGVLCFLSGILPDRGKALTLGKVVFAGFMATVLVILYLYIRKTGKKNKGIYTVKLDFYGEEFCCSGFADSGNSLKEPYTGRPVSILEKRAAKNLIGRVPKEKHYLIPFHSIGKKYGLLAAVELPHMEVDDGEEKREFQKVVIAVSDQELTKKGNYQVILHPKFVRDYNQEG